MNSPAHATGKMKFTNINTVKQSLKVMSHIQAHTTTNAGNRFKISK